MITQRFFFWFGFFNQILRSFLIECGFFITCITIYIPIMGWFSLTFNNFIRLTIMCYLECFFFGFLFFLMFFISSFLDYYRKFACLKAISFFINRIYNQLWMTPLGCDNYPKELWRFLSCRGCMWLQRLHSYIHKMPR